MRALRPLCIALVLPLLVTASASAADVERWDRATRCLHRAQPGTLALERWLTSASPLGRSWGIESCRRVMGRSRGNFSLHAEGRALDWHLDVHNPAQRREADRIVARLLANRRSLARRMGVQELIWNCRIWNPGMSRMGLFGPCRSKRVDDTSAHRDHIHIGLNWDGARMRTSYWRALSARQ